MRFLVDNALSSEVARGLTDAGHDAIHVRDIGLGSAADPVIFDRAAAEDRIVISADTDFGTLLAMRQQTKPSVLLFRGATPRRSADQVLLLLANLPRIEGDLLAGAIVVIEPARVRVRFLPIPGGP
jgi:predicted nuclease of predicted toxin-antitoxin system